MNRFGYPRVRRSSVDHPTAPAAAEDELGPTLYERLKPVIGIAKGLPPDLARNHDHYLYGGPKRT